MRAFFAKLLLLASAIIALTHTNSAIAESPLPAALQQSLSNAYATGDDFVIAAVIERATAQHPDLEHAIGEYFASLESSAKALAVTEPAAGEAKKTYKGSLEGGANFVNGNSKEQNLKLAGTLEYNRKDWTNVTTFSAENDQSSNIRSNEEYRVNNQLRYNLSDIDYTFAALDYVNDRYSGFEYRLSETVGYGRQLYKNDTFLWTGELGVGARQTNPTVGESENSALGTAQTKGTWTINKMLSLSQEFKTAFTTENVITESHSSLKSKMTDDLYLRLAVDIEHIGDAPAGSLHTDTKTSLTVGYEF